jgi:hypothetical protein
MNRPTEGETPMPRWGLPLAAFVVFTLVVAPVIGRIAWRAVANANAGQGPIAGALLAVAGSAVILALNAALVLWARDRGLPRRGQMALWLVTGATFALTTGTGFFSPVNLIRALLAG